MQPLLDSNTKRSDSPDLSSLRTDDISSLNSYGKGVFTIPVSLPRRAFIIGPGAVLIVMMVWANFMRSSRLKPRYRLTNSAVWLQPNTHPSTERSRPRKSTKCCLSMNTKPGERFEKMYSISVSAGTTSLTNASAAVATASGTGWVLLCTEITKTLPKLRLVNSHRHTPTVSCFAVTAL